MRFANKMLGSLLLVTSSLLAQELPLDENYTFKNIEIVSRLFDGGLSERNIESYDEMLSEDVVLHGPALGQETRGVAKLKELDRKLLEGFENICTIIEEIFAHNDKVVVFWIGQAEKDGRLMTVTGHGIYRIAQDGKICEIWQTWDSVDPFYTLS